MYLIPYDAGDGGGDGGDGERKDELPERVGSVVGSIMVGTPVNHSVLAARRIPPVPPPTPQKHNVDLMRRLLSFAGQVKQ